MKIELGPDITTNLQEGPVGIDKGEQAWVILKRLAGPPYGQDAWIGPYNMTPEEIEAKDKIYGLTASCTLVPEETVTEIARRFDDHVQAQALDKTVYIDCDIPVNYKNSDW